MNDRDQLQCTFCRADNPAGATECASCGREIDGGEWMEGTLVDSGAPDEQLVAGGAEHEKTLIDAGEAPPTEPPADESEHETDPGVDPQPATGGDDDWMQQAQAKGTMPPGTVLGDRYRIDQLLGFGGMGAVYRASDLELDRVVALKVIRPHLADDPQVLARFKQEIILAREITHRNVVRIFDIGQADDTRFISMEFIEGRDLQTILKERGALPPEEAVEILDQICLALEAAHQEGVVHRDLKPANIMITDDNRVVVMDFGIARSLEASGMTQTGSLIGTPDYMSPEQVKGETVDARSDIFALGIIFYQMLTGVLPYQGETPMAAMYTRTQKRAAPVRDLKPDLPGYLGDVISRCLEIPVHKRYQSARELLQDLAVWRGGSTNLTIGQTMMGMKPTTTAARNRLRFALAAAAAVVAVGLVAASVAYLRSRPAPAAGGGEDTAAVPEDVVSLAVLPFANGSGEPELDWLGPGLAEMLRTDVGQTASLRTVSQDRVHQVLKDLRIQQGTGLDEATLRRVAEFANADTLVWGQYFKLGDQIRIDATVRDFERHQTAGLKAEAPNDAQLLRVVQELARGIRDNLALSRSAIREAEAQAFIPSASSMVALRHYTEGLDRMRQGNNLEAVTAFESSIEEDADFALAHSELSRAYLKLGRGQKARESSRAAVDLSDDLPTQERYLILAQQARIEGDYEAGVDAYRNLLQSRPADADLNYELALLHEDAGELDLALQYLDTVLEADPQNPAAQLARGRVLIKSGRTQEALAPLNQALSLAIQVDNPEARANVLQALGIAYRILGRPQAALDNFQQSLAIKREIGDRRGASASLTEIGYIQAISDQPPAARASYNEALAISREIGDDYGASQVLLSLGDLELGRGDFDRALQHTREALRLQIEIEDEPGQGVALHNIGVIYDQRGEYSESLVSYRRALEVREKLGNPYEIADTLHNLGETQKYLGRYREAEDYYLRALKQRRAAQDEHGAALEHYSLGGLFALQGRHAAGLASVDEALEIYRRLEEAGTRRVEAVLVHGRGLALLGRFEEAAAALDEGLAAAEALGDDTLVALARLYEGERLLLAGETTAARNAAREAVQAAAAVGDPYLLLAARAELAAAEAAAGNRSRAGQLAQQTLDDAESRGTTAFVSRSALLLGELDLEAGRASEAESRARRALRESERMGAAVLEARSHLLLAAALEALGRAEDAARSAAKAAELLDELRAEAGSEVVLQRADLRPISGH